MRSKLPNLDPPIELRDMGRQGIIQDISPHMIPPTAFSDGKNMRFTERGIEKFLGDADALGALFEDDELTETLAFVFNALGILGSFWIYTSLNKAYVYEGGVHSNITRQTAGNDVDYNATNARDWNGTVLGGIPLLNNGVDIPQYWPNMTSATRLANLPDWPADTTAKLLRAVGPYLMMFNFIENGQAIPKGIWWSHFTDPGAIPSSWDYTDPTVDAARIELTDAKGGEILEAQLLGNNMIVYTSSSTHTLRFVGGTDIFGSDLLLSTSGVLASRCVAPFRKGAQHCVLTQDDVIVHAGSKTSESVIESKMKRRLFNLMDVENYQNSFVFDSPQTQEVWIAFPEAGSVYPTLALIWNYQYNTCYFRDFPFLSVDSGALVTAQDEAWDDDPDNWDQDQTAWSDEDRQVILCASSTDNNINKLDTGTTFNGNSAVCFVERLGLTVDGMKDGKPTSTIHTRKQWTRVWPKIVGTEPVAIRLATQELFDGPVTWTDPFTFNPVTQKYFDCHINGIYMGYRVESLTDALFRIEGFDIEAHVIAGL